MLAAAAARCVARGGWSQKVSEALYLCGLSETALCVVWTHGVWKQLDHEQA